MEKVYSEAQAKRLSNILTEDEMCDLFGLQTYDDPEGKYKGQTIREYNMDYIEERAYGQIAYNHDWKYEYQKWRMTKPCEDCEGEECPKCCGWRVLRIDLEELRDTEEYDTAHSEVEGELYKCWRQAIGGTFDRILEVVDLVANEIKVTHIASNGTIWKENCYEIAPQHRYTWQDVAVLCVERARYYESVYQYKKENNLTTDKQVVLHAIIDEGLHHDYDQFPGINRVYQNLIEHYLRGW